jgi:DNA-binding NtrC family response regulator
LAALAAYSWPGNIRELQNEVERAVALAREQDLLGVQHLSSLISDSLTVAAVTQSPLVSGAALPATAGSAVAPAPVIGSEGTTTFREARAAFEARFIADSLAHCDGNISHAAKLMGISRVQLQRKIKDYSLR